MAERPGVFLLRGEDELVGMEAAQFAREDDFQRLIQIFPDLLVGDQIDPLSPRRWILVKREQQVSTGEFGASHWSIDHVFLDQDGIPTLVEIKRQSDTRIRREVVGQMLDYAASYSSYWSAETLQAELERTCALSGKTATEALQQLLGPEGDVEDYWRRVRDNLQPAIFDFFLLQMSSPSSSGEWSNS